MRPAFPRLRWAALAWVAIWLPAYLWQYGWHVFLNLCDIAVIVTAIGLWTGHPLLLSTQAVSSLVVDLAWNLDLGARALTGQHLIGGTEYMWDPKWPLWLRALSGFHVLLPPVLLYASRRVGYDRRALAVQAALALLVMIVSRLTLGPDENQNFTWRDPFMGRSWGPAPVHVGLTWGVLLAAIYWPTHAALARLMPRALSPGARTRAAVR